jgi:hypothetical protein
MKEDLSIKTYIKDKYLSQLFKFSRETGEYEIDAETLNEIRLKYFEDTLNRFGSDANDRK